MSKKEKMEPRELHEDTKKNIGKLLDECSVKFEILLYFKKLVIEAAGFVEVQAGGLTLFSGAINGVTYCCQQQTAMKIVRANHGSFSYVTSDITKKLISEYISARKELLECIDGVIETAGFSRLYTLPTRGISMYKCITPPIEAICTKETAYAVVRDRYGDYCKKFKTVDFKEI